MATKASTQRAANDLAGAQESAQNILSEQARQQLVSVSEMSCVMCRAAEALQQVQHHMTQRAALRFEHMADQLRQVHTPAELWAMQSVMLSANFQEMVQYANELGTATLRVQAVLLDGQHGRDSVDAAGQAATAAMDAWQRAVNAATATAMRYTH